MTGCSAARRSRIWEVPSVEQSSTMINSRSMFSGSGAASTWARLRSTMVRSLKTGMRMESRNSQYRVARLSGSAEGQKSRPAGRPEFSQKGTYFMSCDLSFRGGVRQLAFELLRAHPFVNLLLGFFSSDSVALLDAAHKLILLAGNPLEVAISELAPLFAGLALELFPVAFYSVPIHDLLLRAESGTAKATFN